ncbi:DUF3203 family protein [Pseudomonas sp. DWP3-1-2]|jgi:hypothetical protein|uniref:DUF3203 family protein n=1 Tax=Pseudomonas sp. DWP3-1-2 TaxID=2804645 RepID=UPI003CF758B8
MPLEFDSTQEHCTAEIDGVRHTSRVVDIAITTNDTTHMSEAEIDGVKVPITEAEADVLTIRMAKDLRHHTVDRDDKDPLTVV